MIAKNRKQSQRNRKMEKSHPEKYVRAGEFNWSIIY